MGPFVVALIERELQIEDLPLDTAFGSLGSEPVQIARTADRSVLGCMNEMAYHCRIGVSIREGWPAATGWISTGGFGVIFTLREAILDRSI
jgi:hypothetical protein